MTAKVSTIVLSFIVVLVLLAAACQLPIRLEDGVIFGEEQATVDWPRSAFAPPWQVLQVKVDEPLYIQSYHVSQVSKLKELRIWVNGQLLRDPQTGELDFPGRLASAQVLQGQWPKPNISVEPWPPAEPDLVPEMRPEQAEPFPSEKCRNLLQTGRLVQEGVLLKTAPEALEFPASSWIVCHVWTGFIPGTYDLSLQVTDERDQAGNVIVQRIEVIEP